MELYDRIISKDEINTRAVDALLAVIANGLVATKADLAECLGAKPAKFSEILNYRMKVGIDMVAKVCDRYGVDPYWVLMGRGNHIFRDPDFEPEPYYIEDDNDLDRQYHTSKEDITEKRLAKISVNEPTKEAPEQGITGLAELFYNKTLEQAEEIGLLKARIKEFEQRLEKTAGDANIGGTANVG